MKKFVALTGIFLFLSSLFILPAISQGESTVSERTAKTANLVVTKENFQDFFTVNADAFYQPEVGIVELTADQQDKEGSFFSNSPLSLNESFQLKGRVNLGDKLDTQGGGAGVFFSLQSSEERPYESQTKHYETQIASFGFQFDTLWQPNENTDADKQPEDKHSGAGRPWGSFFQTVKDKPAVMEQMDVQYLANGRGEVEKDLDGKFHPFTIEYSSETRQLSVFYQSNQGEMYWQRTVPNSLTNCQLYVTGKTTEFSNRQAFEFESFSIQPATGSVLLTTVSSEDTQQVLSGTNYQLYNENQELLEDGLVTDSSGNIHVGGLPFGRYYFIETAAATGYQINSSPIYFELTEDKMDSKVIHQNQPLRGDLKIIKVASDDATKYLKGAKFSVIDTKGTHLKENIETNAQGVAKIKGLAFGSYTLIETNAPKGYSLEDKKISFTINDTKEEVVVVTNHPKKKEKVGDLKVQAQESQHPNNKIESILFALKDGDGREIGKQTTNKEGLLQFSDLPYGSYQLIEMSNPSEYQTSQTTHTITINQSQQTLIIKYEHQSSQNTQESNEQSSIPPKSESQEATTDPLPSDTIIQSLMKKDKEAKEKSLAEHGQLVLRKQAVTSQKPLSGATFTVTSKKGGTEQTVVTNILGEAIVTLPYGKYEIKEVKAPIGYVLSEKTEMVEISEQTPSQTIVVKDMAYKATEIQKTVVTQANKSSTEQQSKIRWKIDVTFGSDIINAPEVSVTDAIEQTMQLHSANATGEGKSVDAVGEFKNQSDEMKFIFEKKSGSYGYLVGKQFTFFVDTEIQ